MYLLATLLNLYTWLIIARAVLSWFQPDPAHPVAQLLVRLTEPILAPLRRLVPPTGLGGIDISPILAILLIQGIRYLLFTL